MQAPRSILSQITAALYPSEFSRCAQLFPMQRPPRGLTAYDQFLALIFGQLTYRESLRDIVCCLQAKGTSIYHLGFRGRMTRTNLAYANHHRDWRVFRAAAQILMRRAAHLYQDDPSDPDLPRVAFALDSSLIALSLDLFPWGFYARSSHSAMKLHLMLSLQGNLPAWAALTEADFPDLKLLDKIPVIAGAYYIMDRGYLDFLRLFRLHRAGSFFVVRNRRDVKLRVVSSRPVDKNTGLRCDQTICLTSNWSVRSYPEYLRRIVFCDSQNDLRLALLTNQFELPALVITELYRNRWQIELFFKWIKTILNCRHWLAESPGGVQIQIYCVLIASLLLMLWTGQRPNKRMVESLQWYWTGMATEEDLVTLLQRAGCKKKS